MYVIFDNINLQGHDVGHDFGWDGQASECGRAQVGDVVVVGHQPW
jgi:hypothetical protein